MTIRKHLIALLLSTTCLVPLGALAQDFELKDEAEAKPAPPVYLSYIEGGALYSSEDSFRFGRYNGITDEGLYGIGNFGFLYRPPWDTDSTLYAKAQGLDLGLESRSLRLEGGLQGQIRGFLSYDQIPYYGFRGLTPYNGVGGDRLVLPSGWPNNAATATSAAMTSALNANLKPVDIKTERDRYTGGLSWNFSPGWELSGRYRHEDKKGLKSLGVAWGTSGGNPLAIIVPEPVDYTTDTVDAKVRYAFGRLQMQFGYEYSVFHNDSKALLVQAPYTSPVHLGDFPSFAGMSLPPDNTAHQFTLGAGYDIGEATRITANFGYGVLRQDDPFLPYSSNPAVIINRPLPRSSLDGQINTALANLELTTRPLDKVDAKLRYRFTDRDNRTPQALYVYPAGDSEAQPATLATNRARINLPYSFSEHLVSADVGYRLEPRTRVSVGYDYRFIERTFSERTENYEHTGRIQVRSTLNEQLSGHAKYARSYRRGGDYVGNAPFFATQTPEFINTLVNRFDNHPLMRKFFEADRIKDSASAGVDYSPTSQWNFTLIGGVTNEDFDDTEIGLRRVLGWNATAEIQYAPIDTVSLYGYYTFDRRAGDQAGWAFAGGTTFTDVNRRWWVSTHDETHTFGLGTKWRATERLTLGADYAHVESNTDYNIAAGSALTFGVVPDVPVTIDTVSLHAAYDLTERVTLGIGYAVERYRTSDFALGIGINQLDRVITLGELDPDYIVHVVALSARYKF